MHLSVVSVLLVFGFPFISTKIVDTFGKCNNFFVEGHPPVIPGILRDSVSQDNNRYKLICQETSEPFYFATLYDITNKIPVFSAYKYTKTDKSTERKKFKTDPELKNNQATDADYKNTIKMSRGHLFPKSHAGDQPAATATFTLTNIVPQYETFNNGPWNQKENDFKSEMDKNCLNNNDKVEAFVVTGAIPSKSALLNNKVNIPTHMWMAFCCYNKNKKAMVTKAYCATNEEKSTAAFRGETLAELQTFLKNTWKKDIKLFHDKCK